MSTMHAQSTTRTPVLKPSEQIEIIHAAAAGYAALLLTLITLTEKTAWSNTLAVIAAVSAISAVLLASEIRRKGHELPRPVAITGYVLTALPAVAATFYGIIAATTPVM